MTPFFEMVEGVIEFFKNVIYTFYYVSRSILSHGSSLEWIYIRSGWRRAEITSDRRAQLAACNGNMFGVGWPLPDQDLWLLQL